MSSPSESRNDQCIGNLCVDKIQSPRIRDLCVDKTQSAQICNLCVEKNPRPRRARTNSGRTQLLLGKTIIGRCSNTFLEDRPMIVFPIRKTPVQILAKNRVIGRCSNTFFLENRPMIVCPIRKTPIQKVARKKNLALQNVALQNLALQDLAAVLTRA